MNAGQRQRTKQNKKIPTLSSGNGSCSVVSKQERHYQTYFKFLKISNTKGTLFITSRKKEFKVSCAKDYYYAESSDLRKDFVLTLFRSTHIQQQH